MTTTTPHPEERHKSQRSNWLRASVLGVDDGLVSTSSLMIGVLAANASYTTILTTGIAGLVAGALSMAAGEYVSVSSQRDAETTDIAIERRALANHPQEELRELAAIYEARGLEPDLALKVAHQLHERDAVEAHARDELGINGTNAPRPLLAAIASASAFALGSLFPIIATIASAGERNPIGIVVVTLIALGISGAAGASIGGGNKLIAALRVLAGGGVAMAITAGIGHLVGTSL